MKRKLFSLLALLMVAATGAWADSFSTDPYEANATLNNVTVSADMEITINQGVTVTVNNGVNIQNGAKLIVNGRGTLVVNGAANSTAVSGSIIVNGATVQATGGQGNQGNKGQDGADIGYAGQTGPGGTGGQGGQGGAAFSGAVTIYRGLIIATGGTGGRGGTGGQGESSKNINAMGGNGGTGGTGGTGGVAFRNGSILTVYGGNVNAIGGAGGQGGAGGPGGIVKPGDVVWDARTGSTGSAGGSGSAGKAYADNVTISLQPDIDEQDRYAKMYSNAEHTAVINSVSGQTKVYITAPPAFDYKLTVDKTNTHGSVAFTVETEEEELVAPANSANENHKVTFTATPNNGYVLGKISAKPYAEWKARRAMSNIDIISNVEISPVPDTENTWTFTMPKANVRIYPEFLLVATFAMENDKPLVPAAVEGVITGEDKAIITAGTVNYFPETTTPQGTVKYFATLDGTMTAEQALAADGWTTELPTAAAYTDDAAEDFKVYVWYYIQAAEGCADSKPECIEVTVLKNLLTLTLNPTKASAITVEVNKEAKTITDNKVSLIKMQSEVKLKAATGYKFRKVEVKKGAGKTITIGDVELTYADGDTWETIVSKNSDKIKRIAGGYIVQVAQPAPNQYKYLKVVLSTNKVNPSDIIDPSKNYEWGTIEVYS